MSPEINGLHHVTAISGAPQRNLDFYAKVLGLRFVKRTVNFDDPSVYHLYYGDETGAPGTAMTFFPWEHLAPARRGTGEVALTAFSVPDGSLDFWRERLSRLGVPHHEPEPRFGEPALAHRRSRRPAARARGRGRARCARALDHAARSAPSTRCAAFMACA